MNLIRARLWLAVVLISSVFQTVFSHSNNRTIERCNGTDSDCLKCDVDGFCKKCRKFLIVTTGQCVDTCPSGYEYTWSTNDHQMGRVCSLTDKAVFGNLKLSGQTIAIAVGIIIGFVICSTILLVVGMTIKFKKCAHFRSKTRMSPSLGPLTNGSHRSQESDDCDRLEFFKQLDNLRPEAPVFLSMLNETRKQVRELQGPSRQHSAIQAYRPVLKDLSRILILLNKEDCYINPPADWETLLAWGDRVLRRYKKQHPIMATQPNTNEHFNDKPIQLTTFTNSKKHRPLSASSSSPSRIKQLAISVFDDNYSDHNRHQDENDEVIMLKEKTMSSFGRSTSPASFSLLNTNASKSMLVAEWNAEVPPYNCYSTTTDDDDFFTLGFRPQDEITTEL
ncbi:uncharacterized protein LOC126834367 isoform X2 [Adelges cooleyi]|uniref:uncharacterized protein LOC126834367 isoform X2 n=1 Tax=Adelges cooleyi TaxID=133065 RepID=UPI00217F5D2A|nr:uncharacterized protein LOC126834367 isoform X2 [Adelges cooleyi]